jgi:3-methyladenine DNA glycosylase AlkD
MIEKIKYDLLEFAVPEKVAIYQNFFKTGEGQYGEGDVFIGVSVPNTRKVAQKYKDISLDVVEELLISKIHEERLLGVLILVHKYKMNNDERIAEFYLKHNSKINNWDLVDLSADKIVGHYYFEKDRGPLYILARSKNLWERRTSIIATFYFIKNNQFDDTLAISEILLNDSHDLIQKAVGWMLREVGKIDLDVEEEFLKKYYKNMPRTMLRYAIEKFPEEKRLSYLKGRV